MRGQGESDKVDYRYKISRFAKDVVEVLTGLEVSDVPLLGHSTGCSVMWAYWDMFGPENVINVSFPSNASDCELAFEIRP